MWLPSSYCAGGSFRVMKKQAVIELIQECHVNNVYVSTGAWIEYVLTQVREKMQAHVPVNLGL